MKAKSILFLSLILLAFACKNSKSSQSSLKSADTEPYRVIVAFISKAAGPDRILMAGLESYIVTFGKKYEKTIVYDKYVAGREGEMDYCFYLKELSSAKQKEFISGLQNLTKDSQLVFIKENAFCTHKK